MQPESSTVSVHLSILSTCFGRYHTFVFFDINKRNHKRTLYELFGYLVCLYFGLFCSVHFSRFPIFSSINSFQFNVCKVRSLLSSCRIYQSLNLNQKKSSILFEDNNFSLIFSIASQFEDLTLLSYYFKYNWV